MDIEQKYQRLRKLIVLFSITALVLVITLTVFYGDSDGTNWSKMMFPIIIRFLLIGMLGGVLSLLFKNFSDYRTLRDNLWQRENEFVKELIDAYNGIKLIRRTVRGLTRILEDEQPRINRETYIDSIERLNEKQLVFEKFKRVLKIEEDLFSEYRVQAIRQLRNVEKVLNEVNKEYEKKLPFIREESILLSKLPAFEGFIGPNKNFPFWRAVSTLNALFRLRSEDRRNRG